MNKIDCCDNFSWVSVTDLGHAYSFDVILGKYSNCGEYWANVFCTATAITGYEKVTENDAKNFLELNEIPTIGLKNALKSWIDQNID